MSHGQNFLAGSLAMACLVGACLVGCHASQETVAPGVASEKNWMQRTGDATLDVLAKPIRMLTPATAPAPAAEAPYESADAVIVPRYPKE